MASLEGETFDKLQANDLSQLVIRLVLCKLTKVSCSTIAGMCATWPMLPIWVDTLLYNSRHVLCCDSYRDQYKYSLQGQVRQQMQAVALRAPAEAHIRATFGSKAEVRRLLLTMGLLSLHP